jgi:hypothetical protein
MMIELKGRGFALLATVLSFIADNRDTQESIRWRLGSPANSDRILKARRQPKPCRLSSL